MIGRPLIKYVGLLLIAIVFMEFFITMISDRSERIIVKDINSAEIGDYVSLGKYEQDNDFGTIDPIIWIVLEKKDEKLYLLSKDVLEVKRFEEEKSGYIKWEESTLRNWLNNVFYDGSFSEEEKDKICLVNKDRVSLLQFNEVQEYLGDSKRCLSTPSEYAVRNGLPYNEKTNASPWWIVDNEKAAYIDSSGKVSVLGESGKGVHPEGIRPCMWVSIQ